MTSLSDDDHEIHWIGPPKYQATSFPLVTSPINYINLNTCWHGQYLFRHHPRRAQPIGRIVFKLFDDIVPKAAWNFRELLTGEHGSGYKGNSFHGIYTGQALFGAYFGRNQGTRTKTIYVRSFLAENFTLDHGKLRNFVYGFFWEEYQGLPVFHRYGTCSPIRREKCRL